MSDIVNKLWGFCHTLRHDGIDYGDYIEQITYLLFLKMADEKGIALPTRAVDVRGDVAFVAGDGRETHQVLQVAPALALGEPVFGQGRLLRRITGWQEWVRFRRMLGLFAFFYGTLHFTTYIWLDQFFEWASIVKDVGKRPFITAGFAAAIPTPRL